MIHTTIIDPFDQITVNFRPENFSSDTTLTENLITLINRCQNGKFNDEIECLRKRKALRSDSHLLSLRPILDKNGILRVGGRSSKLKRSFAQNHQIILPKHHVFTEKIIEAFHNKLNHFGTDYVFSHILQFYWPIHGREAVKRIGRSCITC